MKAEEIATILVHSFIRKIKDDEERDAAKFKISIANWDCYRSPNSYRPGVFGYMRYVNGQIINSAIDWPEKWNIDREDVAAYTKHMMTQYVAGIFDVNFDSSERLILEFRCEDNDYD